jgi:ligand-binding sensor domain-containing protein/DNA-binding CsgD family transcriptional regulator
MRICNRLFNALLIVIASLYCGYAQELPPIVKYSQNIYAAEIQNWMISQDENNFLFFANNEGLLEFNGSAWTLYPSPNETIMRSVRVVGDKIYTGCYMEFGYWMRESNNQLNYHSLTKKIKSKIVADEQFWNILNFDQWIIFQSLDQIYIYDTKSESFSIIKPKNKILKSFEANNSLYFQVVNEGLFEIENGKSKLISDDTFTLDNKIVAIFSINEGLLLETQLNGFYTFINGKFKSHFSEINNEIASSSVYSCKQLSDKGFAVGTVSNGIFIISESGKLKYHITQNNGISNNTVLSLFEDIDKNLWIGLDNGINCINLQSPIRSYADNTGFLGTVYTSLLHEEKLYIGTNQGLFYKKYNSADSFQLVNGTKGQVWSVFEHDGTLFCGHDSGTFVINNDAAKSIYSSSGTWKFESIPGKNELLLQGNYSGISVLEKKNNQWVFRNKISGFDYSSKYFEITKTNDIYLSHEYKGVFTFKVDQSFTKSSNFKAFKTPTKGKNASLIEFNDQIYYANKEGFYILNQKTKTFSKDNALSTVFEKDEYTSGKLIVDRSNKMWLFSKNYINYFTVSKLSNQLKIHSIPISSSLSNSMLGYENNTQISNSTYLIGTTDGYYTININDLSFRNNKVSISSITNNKLDEPVVNYSIKDIGDFNHAENNLNFNYTVPEYNKYIYTEYQFLLEGFQEKWSPWSSKTGTFYKNLPPGDYVFKVRAKIANSTPENIATYSFTISKPWYATTLAVIIYFILGIAAAIYIHRRYKNYYQHKEKKLIEENNLLLEIAALENEQQIMKLKNEQLSSDMNTKNRELAVSTMSLIKKDELLALIKNDLKQSYADDATKNIKSVISNITKNITQEDSWTIFKDAFDNADTDFLKKVKQTHASLTPNDLRLCAYLRLNLSSKEIAPLLNISVRSVEIKRYRLRKKMDLPHEQGLVEYILYL